MNNTLKFSDEQQAIFSWFSKSTLAEYIALIVRARAGTGKTTTIINSFSHALEKTILYVVFNKKNQLEAQGKISDGRVTVKTLHALGFSFVLSNWRGVRADNFVEYDRVRSIEPTVSQGILANTVKLVGLLKNGFISPTVENAKDFCAVKDIDISENDENAGWDLDKLCTLAISTIEKARERDSQNRISFDDMIWLPCSMGWVKKSFDLVVVDEAQDMNAPQLALATGSVKEGGRICLVGDDKQAIYGFRGALSNGMDIYKEKLNATELKLTLTYRCPKSVVALAKTIVPDYQVHDSAPDGTVSSLPEARMMEKLVVGDAVLSRVNAPLMKICLGLLKTGTTARIEGRDIGRTLITIAKNFVGGKSVPEFLTRLANWEQKQINRAIAAAKNRDPQAKTDLISDQAAMLRSVAEVSSSVQDIQNRISSLFEDSDKTMKPAVVCSSVHRAKGLEWDNTFILSDTFKRRPSQSPAQAAEESNIYYVAVTRCKKTLTLVSGAGQMQMPV